MTNDKLTDVVNRSGFPLQIGLEHFITETTSNHGWRVIYSEHSWDNPANSCSGFIDFVLEDRYGTSVMVIESKRVLDTSWIFLIEDPQQMSRRHAKAWLTGHANGKCTYFDFKDLTLDPATPQSQYCVINGQDPKSKPMLERLAADVVSSTEGFALEEKKLQLTNSEVLRMYFNVIVTTAKLQVCSFNPADISVSDGKVQGTEFSEVPYLRFRKQLTYHHEVSKQNEPSNYSQIARAKESTVFIVNAESLSDFLCKFDVDDNSLRGVV